MSDTDLDPCCCGMGCACCNFTGRVSKIHTHPAPQWQCTNCGWQGVKTQTHTDGERYACPVCQSPDHLKRLRIA